jgi:hypothetical protein
LKEQKKTSMSVGCAMTCPAQRLKIVPRHHQIGRYIGVYNMMNKRGFNW